MSFRTTFLASAFSFWVATAFPVTGAILGSFPIEHQDGYIWVTVSTPLAAKPLQFLLDSGAAVSILDTSTAQRLGVPLGEAKNLIGVNGRCVSHRVTGFTAKASGTALPSSMLAVDFKTFGIDCGRPVDGLLGADFFRGRIVQIDYAAKRVRLLDRIERTPGSLELRAKESNHCWAVALEIAGRRNQWVRVDTGCDSALEWFPGKKTKETPEASIALAGPSVQYAPMNVKMGDAVLPGVQTGLHNREIFAGEVGLVGNALLSKYKVTLDARDARLILESNAAKVPAK